MGHWEPDHPSPKWRLQNPDRPGHGTIDLHPEDVWALIHSEIKRLWDIDNDYSWLIHKHRENKKRADQQNWINSHPCAPKFENQFHAGNYRHGLVEEINGRPSFILTHHDAHCYTGFIQSPFKKAVCFSVDGGGDDNQCQAVHINEDLKITSKETWRELMVGVSYTDLGSRCSTFAKTTYSVIDYPGKVMGLSAYGPRDPWTNEVSENILRHAFNFWPSNRTNRYHHPDFQRINDIGFEDGEYDRIHNHNRQLKERQLTGYRKYFNMNRGGNNQVLQGNTELDMVSGLQIAIEKFYYHMVKDVLMPDIIKHDMNLVLTGGCALNVLVVRMLQKCFPRINIYVPRDPEDGGLSLGMLVGWMGRNGMLTQQDISIETPPLLDYDEVPSFVDQCNATETSIGEMVTLLKEGNIMGLVQGNVERGPRALGFRSILCDPSFPNQKERINSKVKRREGYRPFAPACREEDAEKYFLINKLDESLRTMSSIADVREEYRQQLHAITHVDGTARLQTVTQQSNPFFHDLLTAFDGVLLNTSFNLQGKPILNKAEHALEMLYNTNLDYVIIEHDGKLWKFK